MTKKTLKRYERNGRVVDRDEQKKLKETTACVIGCGGLGGYIIEMLCRIGIGKFTVIDGDRFDVSNLNRQLLSSEAVINQSKSSIAKERIRQINRDVDVLAHSVFVDANNIDELLNGADIVFDGLDDIETRKIVANSCGKKGIPFIYGAISGWYGQVATIMPGDNTLEKLYKTQSKKGIEVELGNPSFTPATIASIQVSEGIKYLLKKGDLLFDGFLHIDLLYNEMTVVKF